jgi:hypothetical protein
VLSRGMNESSEMKPLQEGCDRGSLKLLGSPLLPFETVFNSSQHNPIRQADANFAFVADSSSIYQITRRHYDNSTTFETVAGHSTQEVGLVS